ncbi:MAG TPA: hypothetical protein VL944_03415 [Candidatus Acidoferrum sp.]|nr:hypothetical protein [Candidatus Acidoferrum sp.]
MDTRKRKLLKIQKRANSYKGKWVVIPEKRIIKDIREDRDSR